MIVRSAITRRRRLPPCDRRGAPPARSRRGSGGTARRAAVGEPTRRQHDVVVGDHRVLGDRAQQPAPLDEALGQVAAGAHLVDVGRLAVGHVHAVLVEHLAGLEVALGDGAHLDDRPAERRREVVAEVSTTRAIENGVSKCTRWYGTQNGYSGPSTHLVQLRGSGAASGRCARRARTPSRRPGRRCSRRRHRARGAGRGRSS